MIQQLQFLEDVEQLLFLEDGEQLEDPPEDPMPELPQTTAPDHEETDEKSVNQSADPRREVRGRPIQLLDRWTISNISGSDSFFSAFSSGTRREGVSQVLGFASGGKSCRKVMRSLEAQGQKIQLRRLIAVAIAVYKETPGDPQNGLHVRV